MRGTKLRTGVRKGSEKEDRFLRIRVAQWALHLKQIPHNPAHALKALGLLLADGAPTVGGGRLFDASAVFFFTETAVTRKRKVEKLIPRYEMDRRSEGYKRAGDKIRG